MGRRRLPQRRLSWRRRQRLAHPSRMAPELFLQIAPCRLVLLLAPQSTLLQRLWALRGVHDKQPEKLALLKLSAKLCFNSKQNFFRDEAVLAVFSSSCALIYRRRALALCSLH